MHVDEITRQICGILDFDPEEPKYRRLVLSYVNSVYQAVFAAHPYKFAMRAANMPAVADYTTGTVSFVSGSRDVVGVGTAWAARHEGQQILGDDGLWYRIGIVTSATALKLLTPYIGASAPGVAYTIRQRDVALPRDLVDMLGFQCRGSNARPLVFVSTAEEDRYVLDDDATGPPDYVTETPSWTPRTPPLAPTGAVVTGSGSLTAGETYRYCVTHRLGGVESGPSLVTDIEIPAAAAAYTARLSGVQSSLTFPHRVYVYRAVGEDGGFYLLGQWTAGAALFDDDGTTEVDWDQPLVAEATYQYVRWWPRPTEAETFKVRYHYRPRPLLKPSDVPELPSQYHKILVWGACLPLFKKNGDDAGVRLAAAQVKEVEEKMGTREMSAMPDVAVRQVNAYDAGRRYNIGPITKV